MPIKGVALFVTDYVGIRNPIVVWYGVWKREN